MEFQELKSKTPLELEKTLLEQQEKLRDLRFRVTRRELKSVRDIRVVKKTTARILTILKEAAKKGK
ncbi:MAG: 50S ribosomal protein L29 [Patescibacteria group bacterium]